MAGGKKDVILICKKSLTFSFFLVLIKLMVKKITVYTVSNCVFSQQEKDYLKANNLPYEEKNLEAKREYLTEMLAISDNFAGTPVTKIEKDDGEVVVLKGFTKEEFDKVLGLEKTESMSVSAKAPSAPSASQGKTPAETVASTPSQSTPSSSSVQPSAKQSTTPPVSTGAGSSPTPPSSPAALPTEPKTESPSDQAPPAPPTPPSPPTPSQPEQVSSSPPVSSSASPSQSPPDQSLKSVLDDLKVKSETNQPPANQPPADQTQTGQSSSGSDSNLPKIPDFPK